MAVNPSIITRDTDKLAAKSGNMYKSVFIASQRAKQIATSTKDELTGKLAEELNIPIIASGGAGKPEHFAEVFQKTKATGALAASVFHFGEIAIPDLKASLKNQHVNVRI